MSTSYLQIQDQVLNLAGLSSIEWRGPVKDWINEEYLSAVLKTGTPIKTSATISLVNGQGDYDLTAAPFSLTDFVRIQMLIYAWGSISPNQTSPLEQVTPESIYYLRRNLVAGVVRVYAVNGLSTLMLYPAASTGDTLAVSYEYRPTLMATDSDLPALLRPEDQPLLVYSTAYRAAMFANPAKVPMLEAEMQRRMDAAMARQNRVGGSAVALRRGRRRFYPRDNSTDLGGRW